MSRRLTIRLHDGESIVMQADASEDTMAFGTCNIVNADMRGRAREERAVRAKMS